MLIVNERLARFTSLLITQTKRLSFQLSTSLDPTAVMVLAYVSASDARVGPNGGRLVSITELSDSINCSRGAVTRRLEMLAAFGVLNVYCGWRACNKKRMPAEILLNPVVRRAIDERVTGQELLQIAARLARIGVARSDGIAKLQGFTSHVEFGEVERQRVLTNETLAAMPEDERNLFAEAVRSANRQTQAVTEREARRQERQQRAERANRFVEVCSDVWQRAQIAHGRMSAVDRVAPNWWSHDPRKLPDTVKREYRELETAFLRYGGMRAGLAWRYFCGAMPLMDAKDRPQFRPEIPHIQWSTLDKKPSHFAKHLNALFTDPVFRDWLDNETMIARIKSDYGELCDWPGDDAVANGGQP